MTRFLAALAEHEMADRSRNRLVKNDSRPIGGSGISSTTCFDLFRPVEIFLASLRFSDPFLGRLSQASLWVAYGEINDVL